MRNYSITGRFLASPFEKGGLRGIVNIRPTHPPFARVMVDALELIPPTRLILLANG